VFTARSAVVAMRVPLTFCHVVECPRNHTQVNK
jgi:hypothetical protein